MEEKRIEVTNNQDKDPMPQVADGPDYVGAINSRDQKIEELKKELSQAKNREKQLFSRIENNSQKDEDPEVLPTFKEASEEFNNVLKKESSNMEYWEKLISLRDATIREYGKDPAKTGEFGVGPNGKVQPQYGENETIEENIEIIRAMLKEANGDRVKFNSLMQAAGGTNYRW